MLGLTPMQNRRKRTVTLVMRCNLGSYGLVRGKSPPRNFENFPADVNAPSQVNTCANMRQHCLHRISGHHFVKRVRICTKANLSTPTVQTVLARQEWRRVPTFRQEETHRSARMPPPSRLVRQHIANAQGFQREDWALCSPDSSEATSTPKLADMETSQLSIALRMLGPEG